MRAALLMALAVRLASAALPAYTREVLPNGAAIYLLPRRDMPLVDLRVVVKGGAESDPEGMAGLSSVTAKLLDRGTARRSAAEFAGELDQIGAKFATAVDAQSTVISSQVLARFAGQAIGLLADALLRPAFPEEETRKALARAIDASRAVKDAPESASWKYFNTFFFGSGHPYGRPQWGDEISLRRITRLHIRDYYERLYVGSNLIVVAAGDFDPAVMRHRLAEAFGGLPAGRPYDWLADRDATRPEDGRLLLVDKPGATQTYFLIGFPGIRRTSPDRTAAWLVNTILGGCFTSLLNEALRVNGGLTYGAYSLMDQNRLTGAIAISTFTPTGTTGRAMDLALEVLARLGREGVGADQLASVKNYLKGVYASENLQTSEQVAALVADLELHGLPREEVDGVFARIDGVTLEEANAAVKKYFSPAALDFVVLGDAQRIRNTLEKYAPELLEVSIGAPGFGAGVSQVSSLSSGGGPARAIRTPRAK